MLFKILKLFGLDIPAKVDAAKAVIERRVDEVADRAKHLALSSAIIVALSTFAGLFCTMAIGVPGWTGSQDLPATCSRLLPPLPKKRPGSSHWPTHGRTPRPRTRG
jgi:hypothetical protein